MPEEQHSSILYQTTIFNVNAVQNYIELTFSDIQTRKGEDRVIQKILTRIFFFYLQIGFIKGSALTKWRKAIESPESWTNF